LKVSWAVPVIVSILILGLVGTLDDAFAAQYTSAGSGFYDLASTWKDINGDPAVTPLTPEDDKFILNGHTVTIRNAALNYGFIHNGGTLVIDTTLTNFSDIFNVNIVTITSNAVVNNIGIFENFSIIINHGTIVNGGTITNFGDLTNPGTITNSGNIFNCGIYTSTPPSGNMLQPCIITVNTTFTFDVTIPDGISMTIDPGVVVTLNPGVTLDIDKNASLIVKFPGGLLIKEGGTLVLTNRGP